MSSLYIKNLFPPKNPFTVIVSGEFYTPLANQNLYVRAYGTSAAPGTGRYEKNTVPLNQWNSFSTTLTFNATTYPSLVISVGSSPDEFLPGLTINKTVYYRNIQARTLISASVSTSDILGTARVRQLYEGCKLTGLDFNVPSQETPDKGPVVEIGFVNPNTVTATPTDISEIEDALETARAGRALVNIAGEPPVISSDGRALVNYAEEVRPPIRSSERRGRALVNVYTPPTSSEGRALVN